MRQPKWFCSICDQYFSRLWNAKRHCKNKHSFNYEFITQSTQFNKNSERSTFDNINLHSVSLTNQIRNQQILSSSNPKISLSLNNIFYPYFLENYQSIGKLNSLSYDNSNTFQKTPNSYNSYKFKNNQNIYKPLNFSENNKTSNCFSGNFKNNSSNQKSKNINNLLDLLGPIYQEINQLLLFELPEYTRSKILGRILFFAINSSDPLKSMNQSLKFIKKSKR